MRIHRLPHMHRQLRLLIHHRPRRMRIPPPVLDVQHIPQDLVLHPRILLRPAEELERVGDPLRREVAAGLGPEAGAQRVAQLEARRLREVDRVQAGAVEGAVGVEELCVAGHFFWDFFLWLLGFCELVGREMDSGSRSRWRVRGRRHDCAPCWLCFWAFKEGLEQCTWYIAGWWLL